MSKNKNIAVYVQQDHQSILSWKQKLSIALTAPAPLDEPKTVPNLEVLPVLERITETIRYSVLSFEYALSPRGGLRQWLKINFSLLLILGIPIVLFAPLLTFFMVKFTSLTIYLLKSLINIFLSILAIVATVSLLWGTYKLIIFIRYREQHLQKKRQEAYQQLQKDVQRKREEEFQRLESEARKRREEEYQRIAAEVQRTREEEVQRIERELRQRKTEEHHRIDQELQARRKQAKQQVESEIQERRQEEEQQLSAKVQKILEEERQKVIRETRQKIHAWKEQCALYDQRCESPIELQFWEVAKDRLLGLIPQYPINGYRVDFALPDEHLVIELDGHEYHKTKEQRTNDARRERDLKENGWYVIRFTGTEVYQNVNACVEQVERICQHAD